MRNLPARMHPGIRPPRCMNCNILPAEGFDGAFNCGLHGRVLCLPLPASISAAFIFDGELPACHGTDVNFFLKNQEILSALTIRQPPIIIAAPSAISGRSVPNPKTTSDKV